MKKDLVFNKNGEFKILQFTDIHYSEDVEVDHRTVKVMERIIRDEKPDFIIATGDTVYGEENLKMIHKALVPVVDSGIPWTLVFGNHDTEVGGSREALFEIIKNMNGCLAYHDQASVSGVGNHVLEIKDGAGNVKWALIGLDSGAYNQLQAVKGYDYIKSEQIQWYKNIMKGLKDKESSSSSLLFIHIPLVEYKEVWDTGTCYGEKNEEVCCSMINSGLFTAMLEEGHTKGVFAGHDHINDYMGNLYGITLGYGRATGYNTYGQEGYLKGARIIVLKETDTEGFHTYLRLEDGTVVKQPSVPNPECKGEGE